MACLCLVSQVFDGGEVKQLGGWTRIGRKTIRLGLYPEQSETQLGMRDPMNFFRLEHPMCICFA
jgi:hypothetical protein